MSNFRARSAVTSLSLGSNSWTMRVSRIASAARSLRCRAGPEVVV